MKYETSLKLATPNKLQHGQVKMVPSNGFKLLILSLTVKYYYQHDESRNLMVC